MALSLHPSAEWLACLCFNGDIQLLPIVTLVLVCVFVCVSSIYRILQSQHNNVLIQFCFYELQHEKAVVCGKILEWEANGDFGI